MILQVLILSVITEAWSPPYTVSDRGPRPDYEVTTKGPSEIVGCDDPTKYFKPWISGPNVIQMGERTYFVQSVQ